MSVSNFRGTAFVFFSISWLLCSTCVKPIYSDSGLYTRHPLSNVVDLLVEDFSHEAALSRLEKIENNRISLPSGWRSYLAAIFALDEPV